MIYKCNSLLRNCKFVNFLRKTPFNNDKSTFTVNLERTKLLIFEKAMLRATMLLET